MSGCSVPFLCVDTGNVHSNCKTAVKKERGEREEQVDQALIKNMEQYRRLLIQS